MTFYLFLDLLLIKTQWTEIRITSIMSAFETLPWGAVTTPPFHTLTVKDLLPNSQSTRVRGKRASEANSLIHKPFSCLLLPSKKEDSSGRNGCKDESRSSQASEWLDSYSYYSVGLSLELSYR